jgi:cyclopropane-fatty-acyl-phospholipid synthase
VTAGRSLTGAVARRAAHQALAGIRGGAVVLRYPDGRGRRLGDGDGPTVLVDVRRPEALWAAIGRRPRVGVGESYVDGHWDCDDLPTLFALLGRNLDAASRTPLGRTAHRLQELLPDRSEHQTVAVAPGNLRAHYDLGNELFALMLDPTMTYSCAYWERPGTTLEEAQRAKLRVVCRKLRLTPDDHVLEIGCGWGSFAILAAREHGCRVTGLTLSPSQAALARERVRDAGVDDRVEIREQDYRTTTGVFSRIVSIEMLEAIGYAEYDTYFRALDRLLAPNGTAVVQTIAIPDERFERYRRTHDWIQEHVFPGALLPSLEVIARSVGRTRLMITGLEEIGIGYAETLRAWCENVWRNVDAVKALGYDDRFLRLWSFYLAYCEAAFAIRALRDVQLVLTRPYDDTLPRYPAERVTY